MAGKLLVYSAEARKLLKEGIDTLSSVVKITLGPKGRNVILDKEFVTPEVCSDGVTIAKEIELLEPFPNMGVQLLKEAASKTNDAAGDGTTTSVVLAQAIINIVNERSTLMYVLQKLFKGLKRIKSQSIYLLF